MGSAPVAPGKPPARSPATQPSVGLQLADADGQPRLPLVDGMDVQNAENITVARDGCTRHATRGELNWVARRDLHGEEGVDTGAVAQSMDRCLPLLDVGWIRPTALRSVAPRGGHAGELSGDRCG